MNIKGTLFQLHFCIFSIANLYQVIGSYPAEQIQSQYNVVDEQPQQSAAASSNAIGTYQQRISSSSLKNSNKGPVFIVSKYGTKQLLLKQHTFNRHVSREDVTYWRCSQFAVLRCRARIKTKGNTLTVLNSDHNHEVIIQPRKYGSLKSMKASATIKAEQQEPVKVSVDAAAGVVMGY